MSTRSRYCGFCEEHTQSYDAALRCNACDDPTFEDEDSYHEARWERQQEDLISDPPMTLEEQHRRAWLEKHGRVS